MPTMTMTLLRVHLLPDDDLDGNIVFSQHFTGRMLVKSIRLPSSLPADKHAVCRVYLSLRRIAESSAKPPPPRATFHAERALTMKPNEATTDDVKDAELAYAVQFGVQATPLDCHVTQRPTTRVFYDSGGPIIMPDASFEWDVIISAKSPPNPSPARYYASVKYYSGAILADDFWEIK